MGSQLSPQPCRALCQFETDEDTCFVAGTQEDPVLPGSLQPQILRRSNQALDLDDILHFDSDVFVDKQLPKSMSLLANESQSFHTCRLKTFDPALLNGLLEMVWPSFTEYAKDLTTDVVEPALHTALGKLNLGQQITFDGDTFDLGAKPARLTDLKVNKSSHATEEGTIDNIVMRCELEWDAAISLNMKVASHSIGIKHLSIKAEVIVEYVGMIPRPPLFQGVRVFFINTPSIDVSFHGAMTSVLNKWSHIRRKILDIFLDQVSQRFVVPNCWCIRLDPHADIFRINTPRPRGILKISVKKAENLLALDLPLFRAASSDPYVAVHCGAMCFKSPVVSKTLSPTFDFDVLCPILAPNHQEIEIALYDYDLVTEDDFLGKVSFSTREVMSWGEEARELYLKDADGNTGKNGRIWISGLWYPLYASVSEPMLHSEAYIFVGVYGVRHLPMGSADTKWWIECSCTNIMPGWPKQNPLVTQKISARLPPQTKENKSARESEAILFTRKIRLLQDRGLQLHEMATVLEIEPAKLEELLVLLDGHAATNVKKNSKNVAAKSAAVAKKNNEHIDLVLNLGHHNLQWDHAFDFLVQSMYEAELTFYLKSVSETGAESVAGTLQILARDAFGMDSDAIHTYFFTGTDICLRLRLQMRSLGSPSHSNVVA